MIRKTLFWTACCAVAAAGNTSWAVSYASGLKDLGGGDYEFILNADATDVSIDIVGDASINLGAQLAGRHTFNIGSGTAFDIKVSSDFAANSKISDDSNEFLWFERPNGVEINTDPTSDFFGTIYVSQGTDSAVSIPGFRVQGDGIYTMAADQTGLNPVGRTAVTDVNDTSSQVTLPSGWTVAGSSASAWRMTKDAAGNLIVSDWSDANGGIKYVSPDLQTSGLILDGQAGPSGGISGGNHGSIVSQVTAVGAIGDSDFAVYAIDEDLDDASGGVGGAAGSGNSLWKWNVGPGTDYTGAAELVINSSAIPTASNGSPNFLNLNVGVLADATYSPENDLWYITQNRNDGNEAGLIVLSADGGGASTVEFSSMQFTIDNGLDGQVGTLDGNGDPIGNGVQDIIRNAGQVTLAPDGSALYVARLGIDDGITEIIVDEGDPNDPNDDIVEEFDVGNPHLGRGSNQPYSLLVIPLDEDGLPVVELDDNETPGDTLDDLITNWESIELIGDTGFGPGSRAGVRFDAAGNVYHTSNSFEQIEIISPGGAKVATTSYNADLTGGAFAVVEDGGGMDPLPGDADGDGDVDGDDLIAVQTNFGATGAIPLLGDADSDGDVDGDDLIAVQTNFGNTASAVAVPEPTALALAAAAALGLFGRRR